MTTPDRYKQGSDLYGAHLLLMNLKTVGLPQKERQLFWCGYLSAAFGAAIKDLTPQGFGEVLNPILETLENMVNTEEQILAEKQLRAAGAAVEEAPTEVSPLIGLADRLDSVAAFLSQAVAITYLAKDLQDMPEVGYKTPKDKEMAAAADEVDAVSRALRESAA